MPLKIAHITASPNLLGVERLIIEVSRSLQRTKDIQHILASFPEEGRAGPFLREAENAGFPTYCFQHDMPNFAATTWEMIRLLKQHQTQILCAHGHKARMLGWFAAKYLRIPIVGISHGWTGECRKVQIYERIDKWMHRRMDHIVCVSQGQADKVVHYGTPADRVSVIYNAVRMERFDVPPDIAYRQRLEEMFPNKPKYIVGTAGRLSPEKGFDVLINAISSVVCRLSSAVSLVIFGEGFLREPLQKQIDDYGISTSIVLAGFTEQLDRFMPHFDLFVQSSHTEGMPSVLLEAMAARTAVVATQVGGTGELMIDGVTGLLVSPNDSDALADAIRRMLSDDNFRRMMGENGRRRVEQCFDIEVQAEKYWELFGRLLR